ncbi:MAG: hypothetical protein Q4G28_03765 [Neisseria sp.]|nr:hypothetical protein [Neisseria sp.]
MALIISLAIISNAFFIGLLFYCHKKGGKYLLGCGLFFLISTLAMLIFIFIRTYYADVPLGMREQLFDERNEKIEWLIAIFGFVPAVFTANTLNKGLDALYSRSNLD